MPPTTISTKFLTEGFLLLLEEAWSQRIRVRGSWSFDYERSIHARSAHNDHLTHGRRTHGPYTVNARSLHSLLLAGYY